MDATILKASDSQSLTGWLRKHDYPTSPTLNAWLAPYVQRHCAITAFKIAKSHSDSDAVDSSLIDMTFHTDRPFYPYREPARPHKAGETYPKRLLRVYFFSKARMDGALDENSNNITWPGKTIWANKLPPDQLNYTSMRLGMNSNELPPNSWLTRFDDYASPRPGVTDLFFNLSSDQSPVTPTPTIRNVDEPVGVPIELIIVVIGTLAIGGWAILRKRRRTR